MPFSKLEGMGNDFVVMPLEAVVEGQGPQLAQEICERHFGIGADGLILYQKVVSAQADYVMRLFNADGSEAEVSGNGLRCLCAYLYHHQLQSARELRLQTGAGLRRVRRLDPKPGEFWFEVEMGSPFFLAEEIPFHLEPSPASLVGCELAVGEEIYSATVTSMGNPHCSLFVDDFESLDWPRLGRAIETHPAFPRRTNVEFVKVLGRGEMEVRFWERGVGATLASGTGSCAAVVASVLNGYTDRSVVVRTGGGKLKILWRSDDSVVLTGPARLICEGEYCWNNAC